MRHVQLENGRMQKREIAPGIVIYSNLIENSESLAKDIEEAIDSSHGNLKWSPSYINVAGETKQDKDIRDTYSISVPYEGNGAEGIRGYFNDSLRETFFDAFDEVERDYRRTFGINFTKHDAYQILKYGVGQKFTNHIDDSEQNHRRISSIFYINDNYEGGEIVFPRFGITYKPAAGEAIYFPSTYVYNHSVKPVISGTRYAVVSWIK